MPLTSMTGFARADGDLGDTRWHWEVRSVNGKALDVRVRMPNGFEGLEPDARAVVSKYVRRGNCQLSLQVTREQHTGEVRINEAALQSVIAAIESIAPQVDASRPSLDGILSIKGIVDIQEVEEPNEAVAERNGAMLRDLESALSALREARKAEGARLAEIVAGQIEAVEGLTQQARDCPARSPEAVKARLKEQVERLLEQATSLDEDRLHQEAVLLAAKVDVQEEIDRLETHVAAARELLASDDAVGRRFEFLTQEFNREANTLCSKANAPDLTTIGLELKAVIDQMREQVQNIE